MNSRGVTKTVVVGMTGGVVLTLLSLMRVQYFPRPDFVHWKQGFPLLWLTHQTSSLAGAVDNWFLDRGALLADLAFWTALTVFLYAVYGCRSSSRSID